MHQPSCPHFTGDRVLDWTKDYIKLCAEDSTALGNWAKEAFGELAEPTFVLELLRLEAGRRSNRTTGRYR
jgi:hypothetical protein